MYVSCELYLDDIIVFGRTEEEFVHRLSQVFQRFREFNITVNPDKVTLGVTHIEYVGHLVDSTGHSFSREKIDSVINFSKPITAGALQSFIGLTGYFQTHIKDYQMLTRPLRKMLKDYNKRTSSRLVLQWDEETTRAFENVIVAFKHVPTLYFLVPDAPIFLETDACDFGIGGFPLSTSRRGKTSSPFSE
jgi:hypothetical protein